MVLMFYVCRRHKIKLDKSMKDNNMHKGEKVDKNVKCWREIEVLGRSKGRLPREDDF